MSECAYSRYIEKNDNTAYLAGRIFSELGMSFAAHAVVAHIIGTEMLRPALVGSFSVGCGHILGLSDHYFFRSEDDAHKFSHRMKRSFFNAYFTYLASKYFFPVNWKWPVASVATTTFFCELGRTERRSRHRH